MAEDDFSPPSDVLDFSSAQDVETGTQLFSSTEDAGDFGDILKNPPLRALTYGPGVGPGFDKATTATTYGNFGKLQKGDIAISPGLLEQYPMGSRWNVVDQSGKVLIPNVRVADTSWIKKGQPTTNTFEVWGQGSLPYDYAHLAPVSAQAAPQEEPVTSRVQNPNYMQQLATWLTSLIQ